MNPLENEESEGTETTEQEGETFDPFRSIE
jgi:hypothetical protein